MRKLKGEYTKGIETKGDVVLTGNVKINGNLKCGNISCEGGDWDIDAGDIDAGDINAWNINAWNINAGDIICEKRIKKSENNKTIAYMFVQNRSKLKRKEW